MIRSAGILIGVIAVAFWFIGRTVRAPARQSRTAPLDSILRAATFSPARRRIDGFLRMQRLCCARAR
jgi:hypothetical protein